MARKAGDVRVGLGKFLAGDHATRKNSASLRRFLHDLIKNRFQGSPAEAARQLTRALNTAEDKRAYRTGFSEHTTYRILHDEQTISFNQLESLGLYYGVPLALVVIFTESRSALVNTNKAQALRTLSAFKAAVGVLEETVIHLPDGQKDEPALKHAHFETMRDKYLEVAGDQQTRLF